MSSINYANLVTNVPQSQPIFGREQDMAKNNAGGFAFVISKWDRLTRFLILGSEGGSYYVGEKTLTQQNALCVVECAKEDPKKTLSIILDISLQGRAVKQNPTIFALALLAANVKDANVEVKNLVSDSVTQVCRTGTMLFMYLNYVKQLRGLGPSVRKSIAKFYTVQPLEKLDLNVVKYRNREGFTHRDVLRLTHPTTKDATRNDYFKYIVGKGEAPKGTLASVFESIKNETDHKKIISAIKEHKLPWEAIPTTALGNIDVWKALLPTMAMTAMIRNLGKMTSLGMFDSNTREEVKIVVDKLTNAEQVSKSRVHPFTIYAAIKVYGAGRGVKGSLRWTPNSKIEDALDTCMELSYKNIEATGKRFFVGMDVSASMTASVLGMDYVSAYEASAAFVSILNRVETSVDIVAFGAKRWGYNRGPFAWRCYNGNENGLTPIAFSKRDSISSIVNTMQNKYHMGGGTDCALPMLYAIEKKIPVDVFVITTDNESWAGNIHASKALELYRRTMGIDAKLIVLATAATSFSVGDPNDKGTLNCCGFDSSIGQVISEFVK